MSRCVGDAHMYEGTQKPIAGFRSHGPVITSVFETPDVGAGDKT